MNNSTENAKRLLWYYFKLIADKSGVVLDNDCRTEIEGPHYPEPHRWYAEVKVENGLVVKVK